MRESAVQTSVQKLHSSVVQKWTHPLTLSNTAARLFMFVHESAVENSAVATARKNR